MKTPALPRTPHPGPLPEGEGIAAPQVEGIISATELEDLTGLTDRRHRQIAGEGYFPKPERGIYIRADTLRGMFQFYRERSEKELLTKERILLTRGKRVEREILNGELMGTYQSTASMAERVFALGEEIKGALNFHLNDRLPAINAGLDAVAQRVNNRKVFGEILARWQDFAKRWTTRKTKAAAPDQSPHPGPLPPGEGMDASRRRPSRRKA